MKEIIAILEKNDLKLLDEWVGKQEDCWKESEFEGTRSVKDLLPSGNSKVSDKISIGGSPFGTGIFATQPIKAGERLVSIDIKDLILDNSSGVDHVFFKKFPQLELIYTILSTSKHRKYLESLPRSPILPMYFSYQELDLLKHSLNYPDIVADYLLQFKQYSLLLKILGDVKIKPKFGFKKFQWARQVVLSRHNQIHVKVESGKVEPHYCLAPVFDLFNHSNGEISGYYDLESSKMCLDNARDVEAGNLGLRQEVKFL